MRAASPHLLVTLATLGVALSGCAHVAGTADAADPGADARGDPPAASLEQEQRGNRPPRPAGHDGSRGDAAGRQADGAKRLAIEGAPERVEAGTVLSVRAAPAVDAAWTLARLVPGSRDRVEATAQGPTATFTVAAPGSFRLEARSEADGRRMAASVVVQVDQHLESDAACQPSATPAVTQATDTCAGLAFRLEPGFYVLTATATYPTGQAALPCPYLGLYKAGKEAAINYAWPELAATLGTGSIERRAHDWELRWVPTASAGGTVHYALDIKALGWGSHSSPGGRGC